MFVVAEEMSNAERATPSSSLLWQCCQILAAEVAIDVLKHAVLGRFNEIRPGVYREFMRVGAHQSCMPAAVCQPTGLLAAAGLRAAGMRAACQLPASPLAYCLRPESELLACAGRVRAGADQPEPQHAPRGGIRPAGACRLLHPRGADRAGRAPAAARRDRAGQASLAGAAKPGLAGAHLAADLRGQGAQQLLGLGAVVWQVWGETGPRAQAMLGYWLKGMAHAYWHRFQRLHGKGRAKGVSLRSTGVASQKAAQC